MSYQFIVDNKLKGDIMPEISKDPEDFEELEGPGGEPLTVMGYIILRWRYREGNESWREGRFRVVAMTSTQVLFCRRYIVEQSLFSINKSSVSVAGPDRRISLSMLDPN
jgi:hypothetical protein